MSGATYSPEHKAAKCPNCDTWARIYVTYKWFRGVRIRRHKCTICNGAFKSSEVDPTYVPEKVAA